MKEPGTTAAWQSIKGPILNEPIPWSKDIPYQIKSVAIRDACLAVQQAKRKFKATGEEQKVHFKGKKGPTQSCYIPKAAVSKNGLYYTLSGVLRWSEALPESWGDARLVCENGRWFVCLPTEAQRLKSENQRRVVSLDPGIRTFLTYYSETGCGKLGCGDFGRIVRLCQHLDGLQSKISKAEHQQKRRMRRAAARLRWKIRDLVDEMHHKAAKFLVSNFDVILLPKFETKNMVKRFSRKLRSKSVRAMLTWAHFRFKTHLKHKALEYSKQVVDVNEAYTSKTVSWTGELKEIGSSKHIRSSVDGQVMDRDYNGARGIFLRALVDLPIPAEAVGTFPRVQ